MKLLQFFLLPPLPILHTTCSYSCDENRERRKRPNLSFPSSCVCLLNHRDTDYEQRVFCLYLFFFLSFFPDSSSASSCDFPCSLRFMNFSPLLTFYLPPPHSCLLLIHVFYQLCWRAERMKMASVSSVIYRESLWWCDVSSSFMDRERKRRKQETRKRVDASSPCSVSSDALSKNTCTLRDETQTSSNISPWVTIIIVILHLLSSFW